MRKTNAALLAEIEELEKACMEKNGLISNLRIENDRMTNGSKGMSRDLEWHKRMNERLLDAIEKLSKPVMMNSIGLSAQDRERLVYDVSRQVGQLLAIHR